MDDETKELLIKILTIQRQLAAWTRDALVRTCALREALADQDSALGSRYIDKLDHCEQMDDSSLIRKSYEDIDALLDLLEHKQRGGAVIN
jgi:hypothetical protein